jgi:hypothetical protein
MVVSLERATKLEVAEAVAKVIGWERAGCRRCRGDEASSCPGIRRRRDCPSRAAGPRLGRRD